MKELNLQNILNWIKSNLEENKLNIYGFDPIEGLTNTIYINAQTNIYNSRMMSDEGLGYTRYSYSKYYKNLCLMNDYVVNNKKVFDAFMDEEYKSKIVYASKYVPYQISIIFDKEPQLNVTLTQTTSFEKKETEVLIPTFFKFKKKFRVIHYLETTKLVLNINHGKYNKSYESTPEDILLYASLFDSYNAKVKELIETKELLDANLLLTRLS